MTPRERIESKRHLFAAVNVVAKKDYNTSKANFVSESIASNQEAGGFSPYKSRRKK